MTLFKKNGRRYDEATPGEIVLTALQIIRDQGHADLALATELKLIEAVFVPRTVEVPNVVRTTDHGSGVGGPDRTPE